MTFFFLNCFYLVSKHANAIFSRQSRCCFHTEKRRNEVFNQSFKLRGRTSLILLSDFFFSLRDLHLSVFAFPSVIFLFLIFHLSSFCFSKKSSSSFCFFQKSHLHLSSFFKKVIYSSSFIFFFPKKFSIFHLFFWKKNFNKRV